jgi:hypothetical protein
MEYILVAYIYAGVFAKGDSVTLQTIATFNNEKSCNESGDDMRQLVSGSTKEFRFVCLTKNK